MLAISDAADHRLILLPMMDVTAIEARDYPTDEARRLACTDTDRVLTPSSEHCVLRYQDLGCFAVHKFRPQQH